MNQSEQHSLLVNQCLIECGKVHHICRAWKNHSGQAYTIPSVKAFISSVIAGKNIKESMRLLRFIRFGLKSSPDIIGFLWDGTFIGMEIKTGQGKLDEGQSNFRKVSIDFKCVHVEVREQGQITRVLEGIYAARNNGINGVLPNTNQ